MVEVTMRKFRRKKKNLDCKNYLKISGLRENSVYGDSAVPSCLFLMRSATKSES